VVVLHKGRITDVTFFDVFFLMCLIAPPFFFAEMRRWQQIAYLIGAGTWLVDILLLDSGWLSFLASIILFVSCVPLNR
jgi:hypothetical protein